MLVVFQGKGESMLVVFQAYDTIGNPLKQICDPLSRLNSRFHGANFIKNGCVFPHKEDSVIYMFKHNFNLYALVSHFFSELLVKVYAKIGIGALRIKVFSP